MGFVAPAGAVLVRSIGAGALFEVAVVERGGRRSVCKRLRMRMLDEPVAKGAMRREIELLQLVDVPCVPRLIAHGSDDHGPWLLQDEMDAMSVRQLSEAWQQRGEPAPPKMIDSVVRASLAALAALHGATHQLSPLAVVHGDVCPDHVLLTRASDVRLIDFGLARWRGIDPALISDAERGTLPYVAPELARGDTAPDHATDLYALAATLAFLVLGRDPCRAAVAPARLAEMAETGVELAPIEQAPNVSPRARSLLVELLAFDPIHRLTTAGEALARFDSA